MGTAVIDERDGACVRRLVVQYGFRNAAAAALRIRNHDLVAGRAEPPGDLVFRPRRRNAGIELEARAVTPEAQYAFEPGAIHPSCGAGIPGPAASTGMRGVDVDI